MSQQAQAAGSAQVAPPADEATVASYARALVDRAQAEPAVGRARVLALRADPRYEGPERELVDGVEVTVRGCVSALAVRELLVELPADAYAIVLTDRSAEDLGDGLVTRFRRQRIEPFDPWSTVPSMFGAATFDGGLRHAMPWLPGLLAELTPVGGYPSSATNVVTRDHILGCVLGALLDVPAREIGLGSVLERLGDLKIKTRWARLPQAARAVLTDWVGQQAGAAAAATLQLAAAPRTAAFHVLAFGLLFEVLYGQESDPGVLNARRGWEVGYELPRISAGAAQQVGDAARARLRLLGDTDPAAREQVWRDTPEVFAVASYPEGLARSLAHPEGYFARLRSLATNLAGPADVLTGLLVDLENHDLAFNEPQRVQTELAGMAVRLARWLAGSVDDVPDSLGAALDRQVREDGWVDRALSQVWSGTTEPVAATSYRQLCERVLTARAKHDEQFARLLADESARTVLAPDLLPVEQVLEEVVRPLSRCSTLLVVVVDAMSAGVAVAVAESVNRLAWTEQVVARSGARLAVLAALPTLTRYSRTSLLCGALRAGTQSDEKREFAALTGGPLFHKDDLRAPAGHAVSPDVEVAIRSDARVVGVVLNTVDDTLAKHDPDRAGWQVDNIAHLGSLLALAYESRRAVMLVSDHGHVVERGSRHEPMPGAEARWRPVSGRTAGPGEVELAGPRVMAGPIVAAWDENLRYARKAAGYHGGASAAEVTIPLLVFTGHDVDLSSAGWAPSADQAPGWWHKVTASSPPAVPATLKPTARRRPKAQAQPDALFDVPEYAPEEPVVSADLTGLTLAAFGRSPIYQRMRAAAGRGALPEAAVSQVLRLLLMGEGRAPAPQVAAAAGIPTTRIPLAIAGLRRLLNVEGYQVISMDPDGRSVVLDVPLWRTQFELPASGHGGADD